MQPIPIIDATRSGRTRYQIPGMETDILLRGVPNGTRVPFSLHLPWQSMTWTTIAEGRWAVENGLSPFPEAGTGIEV